MARSPLRTLLAVAACIFAAVMTTALMAQPAGPLAPHPYKSALGAVANYQSCGVHARRAAVIEVTEALRSIEAAAMAKGLGPTLERLRREYYELRAVATMAACAWGPRRALAGARGALADFRAWVAAQPGR